MLALGGNKCNRDPARTGLFAVRDPDILHLGGVLEEPAAFRHASD